MSTKILIVDDDEFIRSLTQNALEKIGYVIECAKDGREAWTKIDRKPGRYDLILLDKQMPRMDGIALLKRIKSDTRLSELPVILLTNDDKPEDIIEGLAAGACYYLIKPTTKDVLKLVIQNVLEDCRVKRKLSAKIGKQVNTLRLLSHAEFHFKTMSEAKDLALFLADASLNPARTINGYAELLINAVEHGNLCIDYATKGQLMQEDRWLSEIEDRLKNPLYTDKTVHVLMEKTNTHCRVTITDQGDGFDWNPYIDLSPERAFDLHGRGIAMSKALSFDTLEYIGKGNCVITTVQLP